MELAIGGFIGFMLGVIACRYGFIELPKDSGD